MRPGKVVTIRVNPIDCMSVIDVLDAANVPYSNMSYASMVSLALATLIQSAKNSHIIREPDPFQYGQVMARYADSTRSRTKLLANENMQMMRANFEAPAIVQKSPSTMQSFTPSTQSPPVSPEMQRSRNQLRDFEEKRRLDKSNMSEWEVAEWFRLFPIVYGPNEDAHFFWEN